MSHILGIDVSKKKLDCVLLRASEPEKMLHKKVSNDPEGFQALLQWCTRKAACEPKDLHAVMEATGPYYEAVAQALFEQGVVVSVVNPAQISHFAKGLGIKAKNDKQDASVIARFGLMMNPRAWQPEPAEYRELHALLYRLNAVEMDLQRENNRLEKLQASLASSTVIDSLDRSIAFLKEEKARLEKQVQDHINRYPRLREDKQLLESIPAVGPKLSAWMSLLLRNGEHFDGAAQAAAFVGLTPTEHQSGSSIHKKPHLSKHGSSVYRAKLFMPAIVATKYNPDVKAFYQRLLGRGKPKMAAVCAAMRKLLHICFGVIKNKTPYQPQLTLTGC